MTAPEISTNDGDRRLTKNEKRRLKKKSNQPHQNVDPNSDDNTNKEVVFTKKSSRFEVTDDVEIEYVGADFSQEFSGVDQKVMDELLSIFGKFTKPEELLNEEIPKEQKLNNTVEFISVELGNIESAIDLNIENKKISKKKKKLMTRLSVAELKQLVSRPDVVEAHDVSSSDPRLVVFLKAYRNTVPVPRHWCHIRKYLQGKRGSEKVPYQLPEFIADTGIAKIREAIMEQEELKKSKQKARERIRPKMGKIDIDYQVLHDAFFKYQTKPKMTIHGDLYYEGKEFEVRYQWNVCLIC